MSIPNWDMPSGGGGSDPDPDPDDDPDSGSGDPTGPTPTPTPETGGGGGSSDPDPDSGTGTDSSPDRDPETDMWTETWNIRGDEFEARWDPGYQTYTVDIQDHGWDVQGYWVDSSDDLQNSLTDSTWIWGDDESDGWDSDTPVPPVEPGDTDEWGGIDWSDRDDDTAMPPETDTGSGGGGDTDSGWDWDDWDDGTAPPPEDDWWEDPDGVDPDLGDDFPDWFDPGDFDDGTANPPSEPPDWVTNLQDQIDNLNNALSNLTDPPAWVDDLLDLQIPEGDGRNLGIAAAIAGAAAIFFFWS